MAARHKAKIETSDGPRTCFEARKQREGKPDLVARFGGIILRQDRRAVIRDPAPAPAPYPPQGADHPAPQAGMRALRDRHHGGSPPGRQPHRRSGKPGPGQPAWAALMAKMRRKTLIVCAACHEPIHAKPRRRTRHKSLESPVQAERCPPGSDRRSLLVRGLNALAAVISTPLAAPVIAATRLRGGNAASARGAASLAARRSAPRGTAAAPGRSSSGWTRRSTTPR